MIRDVRLEDIMSVDALKIMRNHTTTGSQEMRKYFEQRTGGWNQFGRRECNPFVFGFANFVCVWQ